MNKALIIIKSPGIGDLQILLSYVHQLSKEIGKPVSILVQKSTGARSVFRHDKHIDEIIDLGRKDFLNVINKIKFKKFNQCYIFSDSVRLWLIARLAGISKIHHYPFFSKKFSNFYKTAKEFTEKILQRKVTSISKIYWDKISIEKAKKDYDIQNDVKNIVCGISASGPTKRWGIDNYIKLFTEISSHFPCKFFLAGGKNDEILIEKVMAKVQGCVSLSKLNLEEIIPIIASCKYYIGNDTGFGHLAANLNAKSLMIFVDSPINYALWNNNIKFILPVGETVESFRGHNARAKDKISFDEVLKKSLELIN
jgi:heptosyltransferase-2